MEVSPFGLYKKGHKNQQLGVTRFPWVLLGPVFSDSAQGVHSSNESLLDLAPLARQRVGCSVFVAWVFSLVFGSPSSPPKGVPTRLRRRATNMVPKPQSPVQWANEGNTVLSHTSHPVPLGKSRCFGFLWYKLHCQTAELIAGRAFRGHSLQERLFEICFFVCSVLGCRVCKLLLFCWDMS